MARRNKAFLFWAVFALVALAELFLWQKNGKGIPSYPESAEIVSLEPSYVSGYAVDGLHYMPVDGDPQIGYSLDPTKIESVCVTFGEPTPSEMNVQVFWAKEGQPLAERRSVKLRPLAGTQTMIADLPGGAYDLIRVDIDGEFSLESVRISTQDPHYAKGGTDYCQLFFELAVLFALLRVLWKRFFFAADERGTSALARVTEGLRRPERLITTEKWYLVCCFLVCFLWSCVFLDIGYGPDETMRLDVPKYIVEHGALPVGDEPELIHPIWGISYGFSISLPYLVNALFMWIASFYSNAGFIQLIAARFASVLAYAGTVFFAIQIGKKVFPERIRWIFVFIMTLTPQVVFLGSYVNLDSFALLTVMMIVDCWLDCMANDWDRQGCVKLGVAAGLCLLSYKYAYSYLLGSVFLYVFWYLRNRKKVVFSRFLLHGLLILGVASLISGWYFIRNAVLYDGDFLSLNSGKPSAELYALPEYKPSTKMTIAKQGLSIPGMLLYTNWLRSTLFSFVSVFGGMNLFAHMWVYAGFLLLFGAGILFGLIEVFGRGKQVPIMLCMMLSSFITICGSVFYSWSYDFQPQGRYIIYALPAVAMMAAFGYQWLAEKMASFVSDADIPSRGLERLTLTFLLLTLLEAFLHCVEAFIPSWR